MVAGAGGGVACLERYGPTETVVGCSVEEVAGGSRGAGGDWAGDRQQLVDVLDERLRVVPIGVRGELGHWRRGRWAWLSGESGS